MVDPLIRYIFTTDNTRIFTDHTKQAARIYLQPLCRRSVLSVSHSAVSSVRLFQLRRRRSRPYGGPATLAPIVPVLRIRTPVRP